MIVRYSSELSSTLGICDPHNNTDNDEDERSNVVQPGEQLGISDLDGEHRIPENRNGNQTDHPPPFARLHDEHHTDQRQNAHYVANNGEDLSLDDTGANQ